LLAEGCVTKRESAEHHSDDEVLAYKPDSSLNQINSDPEDHRHKIKLHKETQKSKKNKKKSKKSKKRRHGSSESDSDSPRRYKTKEAAA